MSLLDRWRRRYTTLELEKGYFFVTLNHLDGEKFQLKVLPEFHNQLMHQTVHIVASGPSVIGTFSEQGPSIFVNGGIKLKKAGAGCFFVVSDPRFIKHQPELFTQLSGLVCFFTAGVVQQLLLKHQSFFTCNQIIVIHNVRDPFGQPRRRLRDFLNEPSFVINDDIGVSLNMQQGYIEAGTVTYIASQLAYFFGAKNIVIHGMDLLNSGKPRFYETVQNHSPSYLKNGLGRIVRSFDLLFDVYGQHGVNVSNASPVSRALFRMSRVSDGSLQATSD